MTSNLSYKHAKHALESIDQLGLETSAEFNLLCNCLPALASAIKQGKDISPKTLRAFLDGLGKKSQEVSQAFGPLAIVKPVLPGGSLAGKDFVVTAGELAAQEDKKNLGEQAYDFYKMKRNWHLMPTDPSIKVVIFCGAQFESGSDRSVRYLFRSGVEWCKDSCWLSNLFYGDCGAAVG